MTQRNPLLNNLLRKAGPPPLWLTAILGVVIFAWSVGSMQPGLAAMLDSDAPMPENQTWLFVAGLVVLLAVPVMVGVNAAVFSVRHVEPGNFKKLHLKDVTRADMAWGYALATLHRMRVPLALAVGLAPTLIFGLTETMLTFYKLTRPDCAAGACPGMLGEPTFNAGYWLAINGLLVAGVVGFTFMGAALGSWAALTWSHPVIGPGIVVAGMTAVTAAFVTLLVPSYGISLPAALAAAIAPYLAGLGFIWLASRGGDAIING